ncbi:hypothetical protein H5410_034581 [Solanum commersonii]|uniref:Uncharacterized protein n=1 Tax=Solanum commersonii TaxID=4109 RepID=A0A9J5YR16_SOLCO|nr:hypothetical protein H5410_034581 [Solanum commersonii]
MLLLTGILMMHIRSLTLAEIDTVPVRPMWLIVSYLLSVRSKFCNRWTVMMKQRGNKLELLLQISTTLSCHSKYLSSHFLFLVVGAYYSSFNLRILAISDEKPIVVLTHGDLLSLSDRTRICMHLGQLLGIHPKKQIFDIPESDDFGTRLTILNMLRHCLEHADKNLPFKKDLPFKSPYSSKGALQMLAVRLLLTYAVLAILFGMGMMFNNTLKAKVTSVPDSQVSQSHMDIDWHATAVDSAPNLQPDAMQPHAKVECHASGVDSVHNLHPEAPQSDENLDCPASEVDTVRDLHPAHQSDENLDCHASEVDSVRNLDPEAPQSDEDLDWGAIRHLWSD